MKVVILIPYFGELPVWMEYFLKSCCRNPGYSWIILSDAEKPGVCPPNVRFQSLNLDEFNSLASSELGLKIKIRNPYKICDLRPAFGIIFNKYLQDADFWGYSDLDLVYGNIDHFLDQDIFEKYDVISARKEYLSGHFALFKNTEKNNELFKRSPEHIKIFENGSRHFAFDERSNVFGRRLFENKQHGLYPQIYSYVERYWNKMRYKFRADKQGNLRDMDSITRSAEQAGDLKIYRKTMVRSDLWFLKNNQFDWEIIWKDGSLFDKGNSEEFLHFHFINGKMKSEFKITPLGTSDSFTISSGGIRPD